MVLKRQLLHRWDVAERKDTQTRGVGQAGRDRIFIRAMPKTLELVGRAQAEEEAKPPLRTVEDFRSYIAIRESSRTENVSLGMCVLSCAEREKKMQLEADFKIFTDEVDGMNSSRHSKFILQLSLWKYRDAHLNAFGYREGFSYRFTKVYSLELRYGSIATGSVQISAHMHTTPKVGRPWSGPCW
ncbi:hypothetical protein P3T76_006659 [Phytophthora citrophthora]|uniref:Uncharacterized protein n=1 Tax=Phytophthora citrophthora TaxID=4793 RepID=A0AAD9GNC2_9STRA|nr:hypothetical protein P3T76_006659 [Phytophthora citrophthora]